MHNDPTYTGPGGVDPTSTGTPVEPEDVADPTYTGSGGVDPTSTGSPVEPEAAADPTSTGPAAGSAPSSFPLPADETTPSYVHHGQGEHSHKHHHGLLGFHLHRHQHEGGEQEHEHSPDEEIHEQHAQHDLMHPAQQAASEAKSN